MRSVKVYEEAWPLHTPFVIAGEVVPKRMLWSWSWRKRA
ncbi:mandelate racemase/muconate lactonizing family protein [Citrobacter koseri]|nr:mandelate racemase/muconate lactonizing family protein [Citrobacter koseri]